MGDENGTRYVSEVSIDREARVYLEPTYNSALAYLLHKSGELTNHLGSYTPAEYCTVGVWVNTKDIIPLNTNSTRLSNFSPIFIESAEYNGQTGKTKYTPRGIAEPWDILKVIEP